MDPRHVFVNDFSTLLVFASFNERVGTVVKLWDQGSLDSADAMKEVREAWKSLNQACERELAKRPCPSS